MAKNKSNATIDVKKPDNSRWDAGSFIVLSKPKKSKTKRSK